MTMRLPPRSPISHTCPPLQSLVKMSFEFAFVPLSPLSSDFGTQVNTCSEKTLSAGPVTEKDLPSQVTVGAEDGVPILLPSQMRKATQRAAIGHGNAAGRWLGCW